MVTHSKYFVSLIILAVLSLGCSSLPDVLQMQKPTASLQGVKFEKVNLKTASLLFDLEVMNPYSVALPLLNLDYQLARKEQPFMTGQAELQSEIPARSSQTLTLPVLVSYMELFKAFRDVRPGSVIPYQADLGLSVNTPVLGAIRLPIKKEGELVVPEIPKASDIDLNKLLDVIK